MKPTIAIKPTLATALLLLVLSTTFGNWANATPIGWTTDTLDGFNLLIDDFGNQWLSPLATTDKTFAQALLTDFVTVHGFGAVTNGLFDTLLTAYGFGGAGAPIDTSPGGLSLPGTFITSTDGNRSLEFILDFGKTHDAPLNNFDVFGTWGMLMPGAATPSDSMGLGVVSHLLNNGTRFGGAKNTDDYFSGAADFSHPIIGTWLYKSAAPSVPEPASLMLFTMGLIGLGIRRKIKRVKLI